jgi:hypothetical protein
MQSRPQMGLRRFVTDPLPERLSAQATFLLTLLAFVAWSVAGWASVVSKYVLMLFVIGLALALEYNIIRHPLPDEKNLGQEKVAAGPLQFALTVFVTLLAVAVVAILDLSPDLLRLFLEWVSSFVRIPEIAKLIALTLNLWFIAIFVVDAIPRWVSYARRSLASKGDLSRSAKRSVTFAERIARDLIAGSALLALLGLLFQVDVYGSIVSLFAQVARLQAVPSVTNCTVSWYVGDCSSFAQFGVVWTITFINETVALALFIMGAAILAFTENIDLFTGQKSLKDVVQNIVLGIRDIWKQVLRVLENLVILVRQAIWPVLVFLAVFCLGLVVQLTRMYLALLACEHALLLNGGAAGAADPRCQGWGAQAGWIDNNGNNFIFLGGALGLGIAAILLILLAVVVQFYRRQNPVHRVRMILTYWLQELFHIGLVALLSVGLVSVVLGAVDGLLIVLQQYGVMSWDIPHPYMPVGLITYLAAVEFMGIAILIFGSRGQRGETSAIH